MNMRDRILKIMEREGHTPSKFAESIGIQRSAMSHIISGCSAKNTGTVHLC